MAALKSLSLLAISGILLWAQSFAAPAPSALVRSVCKQVGSFGTTYQCCLDALAMNPKSSAVDTKGLAQITIQLGLKNSTAAQKLTKTLLDKNQDPTTEAALKSCCGSYNAASASFRSALKELQTDPLTASYDVRIVGDDAGYCQAAMSSGRVKLPSLVAANGHLKTYSNIAAVVTDRLCF